MALLNSPLKEQVEQLMDISNQEYDNGNYFKSIQLLKDAWSKLPYPKLFTMIAITLQNILLKRILLLDNAQNVKEWSNEPKMFLR